MSKPKKQEPNSKNSTPTQPPTIAHSYSTTEHCITKSDHIIYNQQHRIVEEKSDTRDHRNNKNPPHSYFGSLRNTYEQSISQPNNTMSSKLPKPSLFSSRPSNIADTSSISSSTNPSGVPTSLLSGALPPSLLSDTGGLDGVTLSHVPTRPRRLWTVKDTALKPIPKQYPPMNPRCTTYVGDASPSVVAVRISECLRKRSIAVEYDEESVRFGSSYHRRHRYL